MTGREQGSPPVVVGSMQLIEAVLQALSTRSLEVLPAQGILSDYEALVWVACVVEEMGSNNEAVRSAARRLVAALPTFYAPHKVLCVVLERSVGTRNMKLRLHCIHEAGALIERYGIDFLSTSPAKVACTLAAWVGERDMAVRKAALDVLTALETAVGDRFWNFLSRLDDKLKDLIVQHFQKATSSNRRSLSPSPMRRARSPAVGGSSRYKLDSVSIGAYILGAIALCMTVDA